MKKYGIDIFDEWGNVPEVGKGLRYFDNLSDALEWGENHTYEDDPIMYGFMIFESIDDKVIYHSFLKNSYPIESRFEILDL